jgi:hypothetical protein
LVSGRWRYLFARSSRFLPKIVDDPAISLQQPHFLRPPTGAGTSAPARCQGWPQAIAERRVSALDAGRVPWKVAHRGTIKRTARTGHSPVADQADAVSVVAGRLADRAGSATKQSLTAAPPNMSSSMRCKASTLGASHMQIARLTSSCVTLPRSSKPGGNSKDSAITTESHAARSRIVCTTPRCMTPSSICCRRGNCPALFPWSEGRPPWSLSARTQSCLLATSVGGVPRGQRAPPVL